MAVFCGPGFGRVTVAGRVNTGLLCATQQRRWRLLSKDSCSAHHDRQTEPGAMGVCFVRGAGLILGHGWAAIGGGWSGRGGERGDLPTPCPCSRPPPFCLGVWPPVTSLSGLVRAVSPSCVNKAMDVSPCQAVRVLRKATEKSGLCMLCRCSTAMGIRLSVPTPHFW